MAKKQQFIEAAAPPLKDTRPYEVRNNSYEVIGRTWYPETALELARIKGPGHVAYERSTGAKIVTTAPVRKKKGAS